MKLFIVESPTKARTIQRYLGKEFLVRATYGHVMDLPQKSIGVDEETLEARYVFLKGKKKVIDHLRSLARKSSVIYLGTDPDREGEAIAYFLLELLKGTGKPIRRAVFYEISPSAIKKSVEDAGELNMNMVYSQFARRILDRLIGYRISPYLWRALRRKGLSAGRVQSPALRLTVEREREIEAFKPKTYYYVGGVYEKDGKEFKAYYGTRYENPSDARIIRERIGKGIASVSSVSERLEKVKPPRPFITSSLQTSANFILGFPAEKTQTIAQKLYEAGLITYPRTDSHRISPSKAREVMGYIEREFGSEYVGRLRKFRESATSQGAHECIRPVSLKKSPPPGEAGALYRLIVARTLASLMADMELVRREIVIGVAVPDLKEPLLLTAKGVEISFEGWSRVYPADIKAEPLPDLSEGYILSLLRAFVEERTTRPPSRYTEGSLVKALEKLGIGRPSTYATILKTLKKRGYVHLRKKVLVPSDVGFEVADYLIDNFPLLMDYGLTALMEEELDRVERGEVDWKEVVRKFYHKVLSETL